MTIDRRVKTVHNADVLCLDDCRGIAYWQPDPFIAEVYGRDEPDWWCEGEARMRYEEV